MPQRKSVRNLKKICSLSIAKNMDKIWCKDYLENFAGQGQFLYVNGPFDCLPGPLVNDIIQTLREEHLLRRHHLQLLITSNLNRLDLSKESINLSPVLNFISFRCKHLLKELSLAYCTKVPLGNLKDALVCLENLEILDLSWTCVNDDVLGALGANCPKLRDLNLTALAQVTDKGIKYLCVDDFQKDSSASNGVGLLGVEAAIRNLPNLTLLNHPEVVTVLERMHQKEWDAGLAVPKYSLRYSECPEALLSLCKLRRLEVFNVLVDSQNEEWSGRTLPSRQKDLFANGILPVLQTCGQFITTLSLAECPPYVDIGVIGMCCPSLSDLNLAFNKGYSKRISEENSHPSSRRKLFQCLKKLILVCICRYVLMFKELRRKNDEDGDDEPKTDLPDLHLKDLLSSPVLETIFIRESTTLSDSILSQVLVEGQKFVNLRELELENCHNVTTHFIHSMLHLSGPLKFIKIWSCKQITRSDLNAFKSLIKKHKWDLSIDWM
ncbi:hypothetical protein J437_LFUL014948 [Ladona fulva]|uniref:F-box/LRR-repeat protein 15/At3g58940/PEG3-like LRR domain-containing protein n=1 Tax=Ladona fulva TaxID=123851 RepID=A0A8K0KH03_LADFU|nr:hypothetical protein J437_LFUL014948 [Ladona fulva]